jgi:hypothetical protein
LHPDESSANVIEQRILRVQDVRAAEVARHAGPRLQSPHPGLHMTLPCGVLHSLETSELNVMVEIIPATCHSNNGLA